MLHYVPEVGYGMFLNEKEALAFAEKYVHSSEYQQYAHSHMLDVQLDPADPEYVQNILGYAQDALMFSVLDDDLYDIRRIAHLDGRAHDEDGDIKCGRRVQTPGLAPASRPQKEEILKKVLLTSKKSNIFVMQQARQPLSIRRTAHGIQALQTGK